MNCPLCNKPLLEQSPEDTGWATPDLYCPEVITLPNGKKVNHYRERKEPDEVVIHVPPYRILTKETYYKPQKIYNLISKIGLLSRYKTGSKSYYFKTILTTPEIHPDTEDKLRDRIKLLLLLS